MALLQEKIKQEEKITDPRGDKTDHTYWEDLFWNCWHMDQPLYYLLHGIRCGGGEIMRTRKSLCLIPGDWSEKEWKEITQDNLMPVRGDLIRILRITRFGKVSVDELPPDDWMAERVGEKKPAAQVVAQVRMFG